MRLDCGPDRAGSLATLSEVADGLSADGLAEKTNGRVPAGAVPTPVGVQASVLIPSSSGGAPLERLLGSLAGQSRGIEVIVVDNGSTNGDIATLARDFVGVSSIALPDNAGFGRAVNLAAREATGQALILLNDDCMADPGFIEAILAPLDPTAGVTMVSGVLREAGRPDIIDLAGIACGASLLAFPYLSGEPLAAAASAPPPVGPAGAAAAFSRDAFLRVGGFDEAMFAYGEDLDLALRMREDGGTCALATGALGTHAHSSTLGTGTHPKNYLAGFARGYLGRKWSVYSGPARLPSALLADVAICLGQAIVDRNLAGISGRVAGFRAAAERRPYPRAALREGPPADGPIRLITRRVARRRRLRRQTA